jgi:hypothetical protein
MAKDIELQEQGITVAIMRELAGIRVQVPSNRNFPVQKMDELRQRVYELAVAIVDGGTMERSDASHAASARVYR